MCCHADTDTECLLYKCTHSKPGGSGRDHSHGDTWRVSRRDTWRDPCRECQPLRDKPCQAGARPFPCLFRGVSVQVCGLGRVWELWGESVLLSAKPSMALGMTVQGLRLMSIQVWKLGVEILCLLQNLGMAPGMTSAASSVHRCGFCMCSRRGTSHDCTY